MANRAGGAGLWYSGGDESNSKLSASGTRIDYREIDLEQPWQRFNIEHELTRKGVEKFAADCRATLYPKAS